MTAFAESGSMSSVARRIFSLSLSTAATLLVLAAASLAQTAPPADSDCLICHGQKDLTSAAGRKVYVDEAKHKIGAHAALSCATCHGNATEFPHPSPVAKVNCSSCHAQESGDTVASAHGLLGPDGCANCHGSAHDARRAAGVMSESCASCHSAAVAALQSSVHAKADSGQASSCEVCHGTIHRIVAADDPNSPIAKKNLPGTCGSCHANPVFLAQHQIPFAHPVETYRLSTHGRSVAAGNTNAASCSDCHESHGIYAIRDARSKMNHWNVPATCGACHADIARTYGESVHGQAVARSLRDAPVCTDCHGEHLILAPGEPQSPVNPARVSSVTCGRCHSDERLNARYNLPADRVSTFADSYHGLALRAGSQTVANCASCHGVHNIFASNDPRSTVHPANLARTCGACHSGAGQDFAIGPVHVKADAASEHPAVRWIRWSYLLLIPVALGFMFLHHLLDFLYKLAHPSPRMTSGEEVERMNLHFRVAHWLTAVSFPVLVVTGFALKYPEAWWAQPVLVWESRFAFRGTVHRAAGVFLLLSLAYHAVHLVLVRRDRAILRAMAPKLADVRDLKNMLLHNLGFSVDRPKFGTFSYVEKIEYFAFLWGVVVMATTGFMLWFNNVALRYLPKWVSDAATALHFYEAVLATSAILIWHLYTVVFDPDVYPMDRSWLTGKTSADHLRHTRPAYYAQLMRRHSAEQPAATEGEKTGEPMSDSPPANPPRPPDRGNP
jgi:cytochrome b subunit of formate dehydrogenase